MVDGNCSVMSVLFFCSSSAHSLILLSHHEFPDLMKSLYLLVTDNMASVRVGW